MTRTSWLKKIWKGRSKGVSTVIGTVFLILIIFMVSTNVLLWTFSQNALYTQAVKDENQKFTDKLNENVIASNGNYSVDEDNDEVTVEVTLTNAGSVAVQIINLWVFDTSIQTYNYISLNLSLNPGNVTQLTGSNAILVTVDEADSADNFVSWFVTRRGNTIPLEEEQEQSVIEAQVTKGIGSVAMDFDSFVYYNVSGYSLQVWPNGLEGFYVPQENDIAFRVILTNFDTNKRTISLSSHSALWMIFKTDNPKQPRSGWWHIVNVDDAGTITSKTEGTFSDISLPYGQSTMVYFASQNDLNDFNFSPNSADEDGPAAVNLMLFGTIDYSTFGQNIPFVSIYFT